jgi:hypothetical protein
MLFNTRWKRIQSGLMLLTLFALSIAGSAGARWGGY